MHTSALKYGQHFFDSYLSQLDPTSLQIVDIGAQDVNGSLRQLAPSAARYIGVDFVAGKGVDVILTDPYQLPFATDTVDAIVCSSVFEHSEFFWLLFLECIRVLKPTGLLYLNVPSNGMVHRYPVDSWRLYPDAGHALTNWAKRQGEQALLLESFIAPKLGTIPGEGMWNDFVAVFLKHESHALRYAKRILDQEAYAHTAYRSDQPCMPTQLDNNPDLNFMLAQHERIAEKDQRLQQIVDDKAAVIMRDTEVIALQQEKTGMSTLLARREKQIRELTQQLEKLSNTCSLNESRIVSFIQQQAEHAHAAKALQEQIEQHRQHIAALSSGTRLDIDAYRHASHTVTAHRHMLTASKKRIIAIAQQAKSLRQLAGRLLQQRLCKLCTRVPRTFSAVPRAIAFYRGSLGLTIMRTLRIFAREGLGGVIRRMDVLLGRSNGAGNFSYRHAVPAADWLPYVSIIVPNFRHAAYLKARLDSIDRQTYRHFEVILLDDGSEDDSIEILRDYANTVTVINFQQQVTEPGVRNMLLPGIPLLNLSHIEMVGTIMQDLGIELVHSHHAWVDCNLATYLYGLANIRHVVTMHGMYEMMEAAHFATYAPRLQQSIDAFVYIAEKNLQPFPANFWQGKILTRIDNALPPAPANKIAREELGLSTEDFVLCMVARAIPAKGWEEAIAAVTLASRFSSRPIKLLLIGSGEEAERLQKIGQADCIHFLGFQSQVRDYFATADVGLLTTKFKGESAPLVLIECLMSGRPMIASAIGEIPYMLNSAAGMAGMCFALEDGAINIERLAREISTLANDTAYYAQLESRVSAAAAKFDYELMVDKYTSLYAALLSATPQMQHPAMPEVEKAA